MQVRVLTAAVALPLLVGVVLAAPRWLFVGVLAAVAAGGQRELYRMFAPAGIIAHQVLGPLLGVAVVIGFVPGSGVAAGLALTGAVLAALTLGLGRAVGEPAEAGGVALTVLGICYCAWLLGHALWLRDLTGGPRLLLFGLAVTWCGESAAYFVGRRLGRVKLAPALSPGKTMEGAAAQVAASLAAALLGARLVDLPLLSAAGAGLLLGGLGQVGDLAESFLKRSARAKDAGRLLPGHGGLLDRLDSLLFNLPALYYYLHALGVRPSA